MAQTVQNGGLVASFGHPYRTKEAFGDTLGPQNRQGGPLGTILSAQGRHEIFGVLLGAKGLFGTLLGCQRPQNGALLDHFWGTKGAHGGYKKHP